ncbi:MAG: hypothetical protein KIT60_31105 [Burkholderiaceae bacterium]|nr:hypothetical protein [Burkholderiaceae bacterium]
MHRARATPTTAESLKRWLGAWLALVLCAQALAAGAVALRSVSHRHASLDGVSRPMLLWRHAGDRVDAHDTHARAHAAGAAHAHAAGDVSVLGSDLHGAALAALVTAPAPRLLDVWSAVSGLQHVWATADRWQPSARMVAPPRHPPRA